jgi:hypothetical protein
MILGDFFSAFQAGKELSNAVTWKKAQVVVAKLSILGGAVVGILGAFGYAIPLTQEQIGILAGAVGVIVGLFNGTATVVSTERIGLPHRGDVLPDRWNDGERDASNPGGNRESHGVPGNRPGIDGEVSYLDQFNERG